MGDQVPGKENRARLSTRRRAAWPRQQRKRLSFQRRAFRRVVRARRACAVVHGLH